VTPRFIIRPEAESDIAEAYEWYEAQSSGLGAEFLAAVDEGLAAIREMPQRFPRVQREPEIGVRRARLRRFPYGLYFIWDEPDTEDIIVIACMHARRDPHRWLRRA
jgi:plasmid stabilization system protein ParE